MSLLLAAGGAPAPINGAAAQTLGAFTQTATGQLLIKGQAVQTLSAFTQTSTGALLIKGSANQTLGLFTQTASGTLVAKAPAPATTTSISGGGGGWPGRSKERRKEEEPPRVVFVPDASISLRFETRHLFQPSGAKPPKFTQIKKTTFTPTRKKPVVTEYDDTADLIAILLSLEDEGSA